MSDPRDTSCDVLIVGGGLAGLTLARQLLLESDKRIVLVDRKPLPPRAQKVGEATVQVSGYYYSKVLELEEYLLQRHFMKYNLRFYWPTGTGAAFEDYGQSYIRQLSNIPTYQLDRNEFEAEVLRRNCADPRFRLHAPVEGLEIELSKDGGRHGFRFRGPQGPVAGTADWVVDAAGRGRVLARRMELLRESPIRHGSTFCWVEGLVDIEKLTGRSPREIRQKPERAELGHVPPFLATNHFCGEGFWFWTIPLHGITSLGLVYDSKRVKHSEVATAEKMIDWVCERFPLFAPDLKKRKIVDKGGYASFAHDCAQVLSEERWAMVGEAGRFTDPLYSPGGDLISLYNTLVCDAICTEDRERLPGKVRLYEAMQRAFYESYVPSFAVSYDTLGDQECFSLRYVWELSVYFSYYVFPFINGLFTDPTFGTGYLRRLTQLGPKNRGLHELLNGFYHWKKRQGLLGTEAPVNFEFMQAPALRSAESCFYKMGLSSEAARRVLDEQLSSLDELARFIVAHVAGVVTRDPRAHSEAFVRGIDFEGLVFDEAALRARVADVDRSSPPCAWSAPPPCLRRFRKDPEAQAREAGLDLLLEARS